MTDEKGKDSTAIRIRICLLVAGLTAAVFLYLMWKDNTHFVADSASYWRLGKSFWGDGAEYHFSLNNYPKTIRGYLLPLLLGLSRGGGLLLFHNAYVLFRAFYSFCTVFLITVVLPGLFDTPYGTRRWIAGSILSTGLFVLFWKDLILYPLSDMIALLVYALSILLLGKSGSLPERATWKQGCTAFLAGFLIYAAYNIRTVYLIPLAVVVVAWFAGLVRKRRAVVLKIACLLAGILLAAIPQMKINHHYYGTYSPMLVTASYGQDSLFLAQLDIGTYMPRYETFIGSEKEYPSARVKYISDTGWNIYRETPVSSVGEFVIRALRHPLESVGIYFEHIVSGITLFYDEAYLHEIRVGWKVFSLNMVLYLLAFLGLAAHLNAIGKNAGIRYITVAILIFPAVLAMPGALEARFFLPVYLLVYLFVTLYMDYRLAWTFFCRHKAVLAVTAACIVMVWCMTATHLLSSLEFGELGFGCQRYITETSKLQ